MAQPRCLTVDPTASLIYHCYSRCARSLGLVAGAARVAWLIERLRFLASIFAIDVCEYAIMDNHVHVILRPQPELAWALTNEEIASRWLLLRGKGLDERGVPRPEAVASLAGRASRIDLLRRRLADLGWFHKELKEPCARRWNREERVRGAFWDGRYGAKIADTDVALVNQAIYVLLNRIRCGAEDEIGQTESTSIGQRIAQLKKELQAGEHTDAVAAFENRFADAAWTPVFPCDPGSVRHMEDAEFARRVARGMHQITTREALAQHGSRLMGEASDAEFEAVVVMVARSAETTNVLAGPDRSIGDVTCESHPRRSRAVPSPRRDESSWLRPMSNPFATPRAASNGAIPVLPGMPLSLLIQLADEEGRRKRPDKPCRIASTRPPAMESLRRQAGAGSSLPVLSDASNDAGPRAESVKSHEGLGEGLKRLVEEVETLAMRHHAQLESLCAHWAKVHATTESGRPQGDCQVRWRGTVSQVSAHRPRAQQLRPTLAWL